MQRLLSLAGDLQEIGLDEIAHHKLSPFRRRSLLPVVEPEIGLPCFIRRNGREGLHELRVISERGIAAESQNTPLVLFVERLVALAHVVCCFEQLGSCPGGVVINEAAEL